MMHSNLAGRRARIARRDMSYSEGTDPLLGRVCEIVCVHLRGGEPILTVELLAPVDVGAPPHDVPVPDDAPGAGKLAELRLADIDYLFFTNAKR